MTAAIARFNQVVCDVVAAHDGVRPVEQGEGDSFVAAFARASDAVAAAVELQRAPLAPIRLRIGVHTGEIQLRDEGNYAGPTINRTARLRDLGHGGQTLLSGATEPLVLDRLPEGAWVPVAVFQLRCSSSVRAWSIWSYAYVATAAVVIVSPLRASDS
jgi:class 3 adenylate cyclase